MHIVQPPKFFFWALLVVLVCMCARFLFLELYQLRDMRRDGLLRGYLDPWNVADYLSIAGVSTRCRVSR